MGLERVAAPVIVGMAVILGLVIVVPLDAVLCHVKSQAIMADYRRVWDATTRSAEVGEREVHAILDGYRRHREILDRGEVREVFETRVGLFPWGDRRRAVIEVLYSRLGRVVSVSLELPAVVAPRSAGGAA